MARKTGTRLAAILLAATAATAVVVGADDIEVPRLAQSTCAYVQDLMRDPLAWREHKRLLAEDSDSPLDATAPDRISMTCLACHDGFTAPSASVQVGEPGRSIGASHPIGMSYERAAASGGIKYHPPESLPEGMTFVSGRVGCLTCHDLASRLPAMLSVEIAGSRLCLACHNV